MANAPSKKPGSAVFCRLYFYGVHYRTPEAEAAFLETMLTGGEAND